MIGAVARKLFGSANERRIRSYQPRVEAINALEKELEALSDDALKARTENSRSRLPKAFRSTTFWFPPLLRSGKRPSARSVSVISTSS